MTSLRQMESNRRNALKSTGPQTDSGKQRSSRNAVRHGLTAETVIPSLEDAEDYAAFELAVTSAYDAESAVERELVLRLASLLWRLRRSTMIETQLFEIQSEEPWSQPELSMLGPAITGIVCREMPKGVPKTKLIAEYFLRVAGIDDGLFERLGRYEAALWRQVRQTIFTLKSSSSRRSIAHHSGPFRWSNINRVDE